MATQPEILLVEPFYGGSHKQLIDLLTAEFQGSELVTMTAKKWHWRARTASLYLSQVTPRKESYRVLFASSVLNLAELVSLRPDLAKLKKVLYFHENQLVYPVRKQQERDFQYGYNQILSCLVANVVVFNSKFNRDSFLENISKFLKLIPDYRPKNLKEIISPKCKVIYFPLKLPPKTLDLSLSSDKKIQSGDCDVLKDKMDCVDSVERPSKLLSTNITETQGSSPECSYSDTGKRMKVTEDVSCFQDISGDSGYPRVKKQSEILDHKDDRPNRIIKGQSAGIQEDADPQFEEATLNLEGHSMLLSKDVRPLHIVWPHRWEHDKGPGVFFQILHKLDGEGLDFKVSVLGETYQEIAAIFTEAKEKLSSHILHWGFVESKEEYYEVLRSADVVVSTANHEFFGVAMLESVHLGCYPLCPNRLVYQELFQGDYLYNTDQQLFKRLRNFCRRPKTCRSAKINVDVEKYSWDSLQPSFKELLSWDTFTWNYS